MKGLTITMRLSAFLLRSIFFSPDDGAGSGGGGGNGGNGDGSGGSGGNAGGGNAAGGEGGTGTASGNGGTGNGDPSKNTGAGEGGTAGGSGGSGAGSGSGKPTFTAEQQAEIDRIASKARADGKKSAETAANEEAAKKRGEFERLYNELNTRVSTELEPKAKLADELTDRVNALLDGEVSAWPDVLKKQDPGKDDVKTRLRWVEVSRDLAKELSGKRAPNTEHGSGGSGGGNGGTGSGKTALQIVGSRYRVPGKK